MSSKISQWRLDWAGKPCWWCQEDTLPWQWRGEVHHIASGSCGRHDELWQFSWLCSTCHKFATGARNATSEIAIGRLVFLKSLYDPKFFDLAAMEKARGRPMPDLIEIISFDEWETYYHNIGA